MQNVASAGVPRRTEKSVVQPADASRLAGNDKQAVRAIRGRSYFTEKGFLAGGIMDPLQPVKGLQLLPIDFLVLAGDDRMFVRRLLRNDRLDPFTLKGKRVRFC